MLGGHDIRSTGTNHALWTADGSLVTGLCCGLAHQVQLWSLPEGRRLRTVEFGAPTWWQVES